MTCNFLVNFIKKNKFWCQFSKNLIFMKKSENKIRDFFKVKLYTIRSETKKRERERHMFTLELIGGVISDPNYLYFLSGNQYDLS